LNDFATLKIENVIFHEVIRQLKSDDKVPPIFSETESGLITETHNFLKDRVHEAVKIKSIDILFDESLPSPIPAIVTELFELSEDNGISEANLEKFVELSKEAAKHLNNIQTGRNPGGLISVMSGTNKGRRIIALLKIEREVGARLVETEKDHKRTLSIETIKDLILLPKTKFLKIGLFYKDKTDDTNIIGKLCDNQISGKGDFANFYLKDYLGCKFKDDPKIKTREYLENSLEFFKEKITDPPTQSKYKMHLLSYVSAEPNIINPLTFSSTYIQEQHRANYKNYLVEKGVGTGKFHKDTQYIESKIRSMILEFENGVQVIAPSESFEGNVTLEEFEDGSTKATIQSRIKKM